MVFTVLLVLVCALQAGAGQIYMNSLESKWVNNGWLYWSSLYIVNPGNGAVQEVGQVQLNGAPLQLNDIAYSPITGKMYGIYNDGEGHPGQLYTLDFQNPVAGAVPATLVANLAVGGLEGLTASLDGSLYAGSFAPGNLYRLNPANGQATLVGPMSTPRQTMGMTGDLDFGDNDAALLGIVTVQGAHPPYYLAALDQHTGTASPIGVGFQEYVDSMVIVGRTVYGGDIGGDFLTIDLVTGDTYTLGNNGLWMRGMTYVPYNQTGARALTSIQLLLED
jgi:hypothetical protein